MSAEIEESTDFAPDFGKLHKVVASGEDLIPVVAQDADSGEVLIIAYTNREAFEETVRTGKAVFYSTSRRELWRKGAESGDVLEITDIRINCEQNSLLYLVRKGGGSCHTRNPDGSTRSGCYYRRVQGLELEFIFPNAANLKG